MMSLLPSAAASGWMSVIYGMMELRTNKAGAVVVVWRDSSENKEREVEQEALWMELWLGVRCWEGKWEGKVREEGGGSGMRWRRM